MKDKKTIEEKTELRRFIKRSVREFPTSDKKVTFCVLQEDTNKIFWVDNGFCGGHKKFSTVKLKNLGLHPTAKTLDSAISLNFRRIERL